MIRNVKYLLLTLFLTLSLSAHAQTGFADTEKYPKKKGLMLKSKLTFSLTRGQILNAYAEVKKEKEVIVGGETVKRMLFDDVSRTDVDASSIASHVQNTSYNEGKLRVKNQYIRSMDFVQTNE